MKKLFVYGLSIALVAGATSCGKSSKGKMSNEWTISKMESTSTYSDSNGSDSETMTIDGSTLTIVNVDSPTGGSTTTTTTNGTVNSATSTISKDGTWSRTIDITIVDEYDFGGTVYTITSNSVMTESGTWDFLKGVGEFKKNERIVFNTLSSSTENTTTTEGGGTSSTSTDSSSDTYAEGEMSDVMVIVESKKKELQMTSEESNSYSSSSSSGGTTNTWSSTSTGSMSITMTAE